MKVSTENLRTWRWSNYKVQKTSVPDDGLWSSIFSPLRTSSLSQLCWGAIWKSMSLVLRPQFAIPNPWIHSYVSTNNCKLVCCIYARAVLYNYAFTTITCVAIRYVTFFHKTEHDMRPWKIIYEIDYMYKATKVHKKNIVTYLSEGFFSTCRMHIFYVCLRFYQIKRRPYNFLQSSERFS